MPYVRTTLLLFASATMCGCRCGKNDTSESCTCPHMSFEEACESGKEFAAQIVQDESYADTEDNFCDGLSFTYDIGCDAINEPCLEQATEPGASLHGWPAPPA